jgi:hypothetical protein
VDGFANDVALLDVADRATAWGGVRFVPAALWTDDGWGASVPAEPLRDYSTAYLPLGLRPDGFNLLEFSDALWVRARLPIVFGVAPPTCRRPLRGQFLNFGMLAVTFDANGERNVTPFVCTDRDLQAELRFGPRTTPDQRRTVATAFWGLLASDPAALASYKDRVWLEDGHGPSPAVVGYWRGSFQMICGRGD